MKEKTINSYEFIKSKIQSMKDSSFFRSKKDEYIFSALSVKSHFYKNPALILNDPDLAEMIVDSQYDGGVDILLSDPSSEGADLVIGQSKFYESISFDDVFNAINKMVTFYKDMCKGYYGSVNEKVLKRFHSLGSEIGDESKIQFVFYTSAPQARINKERLERKFRDLFEEPTQFTLSIFFGNDLIEEIREAESRKATVEQGKIKIDKAGNHLIYDEENAAMVNVSAFSIKKLYAQYSTQLLARNLRYHIKGKEIDNGIKETICKNPKSFWLKNNGITIVCDDFRIDGKEVKLYNFSIVNGGQTTYLLSKSEHVNENQDFYLPCKIIKNIGDNEGEKIDFSLAIAKAVNTQKPIKPVDLKANSKEQVLFANAMREVGVFYQTKRGQEVPKDYRVPYLNTDLVEIGKLCLAAIFQIPCISRSKPSSMYNDQYYEKIFNKDQMQVAKLSKELLYIDCYFRNIFIKKYDSAKTLRVNVATTFAHNARTICIAFVAFASRFYYGHISDSDLKDFFSTYKEENMVNTHAYRIFSNIKNVEYFIPSKEHYDITLDKLFNAIIESGVMCLENALEYDRSLNATNFLKKDSNYYKILVANWSSLEVKIKDIFNELKK